MGFGVGLGFLGFPKLILTDLEDILGQAFWGRGGGLTCVEPGGGAWLKAEAMLLCTALSHRRCCPAESACSTQLLGGAPQKGCGVWGGHTKGVMGTGGAPQEGYWVGGGAQQKDYGVRWGTAKGLWDLGGTTGGL